MTPSELITALSDRGSSTPEWAVEAYEKELGVRLPDDYRSFLLACNGGWSSALECTWEVPPYTDYYGVQKNTMTLDVLHFFGLREEWLMSLEARNDFLADEIPPSVIWFVSANLGTDRWCLGIRGEYAGKVYHWWHDGIYPEGKDENIVEFDLVANSFSEFVQKISFMKE